MANELEKCGKCECGNEINHSHNMRNFLRENYFKYILIPLPQDLSLPQDLNALSCVVLSELTHITDNHVNVRKIRNLLYRQEN